MDMSRTWDMATGTDQYYVCVCVSISYCRRLKTRSDIRRLVNNRDMYIPTRRFVTELLGCWVVRFSIQVLLDSG